MANAKGVKTSVGYVDEATGYGVTPTTPSLLQVPFSSVTFGTSPEELVDSRIDGSRELNDIEQGNKTSSIELSGEFSPGDYDEFIENAMLNTFSTGVVTVGETLRSFTMEESQLDITTFRKMSGVVINSMSVDASIDGYSTISFSGNGKEDSFTLGGSTAGTSLDADGYTAAAFNAPFTHVGGVVTEGGGDLSATVQGVSLEVSNGYTPSFGYGSDFAALQDYTKVSVTGTLNVRYYDSVMINKFLSGAESSITFTLSNGDPAVSGTVTYSFIMDKIKYTGADTSVSDDSVRTIALPFTALANANTPLKITIVTTA